MVLEFFKKEPKTDELFRSPQYDIINPIYHEIYYFAFKPVGT